MTKAENDAFHGGMCAALAVVALHDQQTVWEEIVKTTNRRALIAWARREDALEWAGFVRYGYARRPRSSTPPRNVNE